MLVLVAPPAAFPRVLLQPMVWFFEKDGTYLRIESRFREGSPRYELVWTGLDGQERVEMFDSESELLQRYDAITTDLRLSGWAGPSTWRI